MKKILLTVLVMLVIITSCAKKEEFCTVSIQNGVTTYSNKNRSQKLDLKLQKVAEIISSDSLFGSIGQVAVSPQSELYFLDAGKMKILKFAADGKFLTTFGERGTGPGEFQMGAMLFFANNELVVGDALQKKLVIFTPEGIFSRFIENIPTFPAEVRTLSDGKIIAMLASPEQKSDGLYLTASIAYLDSAYKEQKSIFKDSKKIDMANPMGAQKNLPMFATGTDKVYLTVKNTDKYQIDAYSLAGVLTEKINRNYQKVPYNPVEIADAQKKIDDKLKLYGVPLTFKFEEKFKNAVNWLGVDAKKRLWVNTSVEDKAGLSKIKRFDIYEDGKIAGYTEIETSGDLLLANDLLYLIDRTENKIEIYKYE